MKVNTFPYSAVVNKVMQKQQQLQQAATAAPCLARSQMNNYYWKVGVLMKCHFVFD